MANPDHIDILKQGVKAWNTWRSAHPSVQPDLQEANFTGMNLSGVNFSEAYLGRTTFHKAILQEADLREAALQGAVFLSANLKGANIALANLTIATLEQASLIGAVLRGADLRKANCIMANLHRACLQEANLTEARLDFATLHQTYLQGTVLRQAIFFQTALADVNLTKAIGLEECIHHGPSFIDFHTLRYGPLPLAFLRGCGLPNNLIESLPSLLNALQFHSCFISYSTKDQEFAKRLHADLQDKGVQCWFASRDIQGGKKIHEQIDQAIRVHDKLLLVLSEHSMNSEWVKTEIAHARQREISENKRVLFPIRLVDFETIRNWKCFDADTGKDSAREIREYFISDFSNWKEHDAYQEAFNRLLQDLKAADKQE
jgi:uncharacterized protein YjbI with pentapeptide repeats